MTLTSDQARDQFSAAYDNEWSAAERAAFEDALAKDAELRAEYEEFVQLIRATSALSDEAEELKTPDLVAGVQARLRARSGGRFFRDRFSEKSGPRGLMPILLLSVMLFVVLLAWTMMQFARELEPAETSSSTHSRAIH